MLAGRPRVLCTRIWLHPTATGEAAVPTLHQCLLAAHEQRRVRPHLVRRPITPCCAKLTCAGSNKFSSRYSADSGSSRWYLSIKRDGHIWVSWIDA